MGNKKNAEAVALRFIKAMKHVIAEELHDVTNQKEFADKIGEYSQNISKMESGNRYPTIEVLCNLCTIFDINPTWLLIGQGDMFLSSGSLAMGNILDRLQKLEKTVASRRTKLKSKVA